MTRVIKIGGRVQRNERLPGTLARLWSDSPATFCVVHGGGEAVSALQAQLGRRARFVDGRRVTTHADIEVLRMSLSGVVNKELVASLSAEGIPAVGVSGEDASLLVARAMNAAALGLVGEVAEVNDALLRMLLACGYLPVISPVARDGESAAGGALNVNGDDAAAAIAASLGAEELLLISDVAGVMIGGVAVATLSDDEATHAIDSGVATEGMATKLHAALDALRRGVPQVRIGGLDSLLDSDLGTTLFAVRQLA